MTRVTSIEPIAAAVWRVTAEIAGEVTVSTVIAQSLREAWEKAVEGVEVT